jgi:membrane protease YdiL (CAAX protease family)
MQEILSLFNKSHYAIRIAVLTLYIALVNSYALFIVYPTIKGADVGADILSLAVYAVLTVPLLGYIAQRFQPKPRRAVIIAGITTMIIATIVQYAMSHVAVPILLLHIVLYLFAGMIEETLWRGKLWQLVSRKVKSPIAVLAIVTAHFVILHIPFAFLEKQPPLGFLAQVLALGIVLGILRIVTKKVTVPAFAHAIINMVVYT